MSNPLSDSSAGYICIPVLTRYIESRTQYLYLSSSTRFPLRYREPLTFTTDNTFNCFMLYPRRVSNNIEALPQNLHKLTKTDSCSVLNINKRTQLIRLKAVNDMLSYQSTNCVLVEGILWIQVQFVDSIRHGLI